MSHLSSPVNTMPAAFFPHTSRLYHMNIVLVHFKIPIVYLGLFGPQNLYYVQRILSKWKLNSLHRPKPKL